MWWFKGIVILSLLSISYQDLKDKAVSLYWFPILGFSTGYLHFSDTLSELFLINVGINLSFIGFILIFLWTYIKLKNKQGFFEVFGSGDFLMFIALAFSMASVTFIVCFVFSILFALVLSLVLKHKSNQIPLAGYMAVFFLIIYLAHWSGWINQLYSI